MYCPDFGFVMHLLTLGNIFKIQVLKSNIKHEDENNL